MRIVAGKYGGRVLQVPKGKDIRPTSDKVRGAIFNALESRGAVQDAIVLDGFCGTGALGLEALSRGAAGCTFVDQNRSSLDLARKNAELLGAEDAAFLLKDMTKLGPRPETIRPADLIFLDPPYDQGLMLSSLNTLHNSRWIGENALIATEMEVGFDESFPAPFVPCDEKIYGDTKVVFLEYDLSV